MDVCWTDDLAHLHVPAHCFAEEPLSSTAAELARRVRWRGATVSVDASSTGMLRRYGGERFHRMLDSLAPSFLFANRSEAEFLGVHGGAGIPQISIRGRVETLTDEDAGGNLSSSNVRFDN